MHFQLYKKKKNVVKIEGKKSNKTVIDWKSDYCVKRRFKTYLKFMLQNTIFLKNYWQYKFKFVYVYFLNFE